MFKSLLLAQEGLLNRVLKLDPELLSDLSRLNGKVVEIDLKVFKQYWLFKPNAILITEHYDGLIDLTLSGSFWDFARLALISKNISMTTLPIKVFGNMEVAKAFYSLFSEMNIDWEEQLSNIVGDTLAYPTMQFLRMLKVWCKRNLKSMRSNLTDYLQIETDSLVPKEELDIFFSDIDELRNDLARLEVRLIRMRQLLQ